MSLQNHFLDLQIQNDEELLTVSGNLPSVSNSSTSSLIDKDVNIQQELLQENLFDIQLSLFDDQRSLFDTQARVEEDQGQNQEEQELKRFYLFYVEREFCIFVCVQIAQIGFSGFNNLIKGKFR